jgi:hypothetical protein
LLDAMNLGDGDKSFVMGSLDKFKLLTGVLRVMEVHVA